MLFSVLFCAPNLNTLFEWVQYIVDSKVNAHQCDWLTVLHITKKSWKGWTVMCLYACIFDSLHNSQMDVAVIQAKNTNTEYTSK